MSENTARVVRVGIGRLYNLGNYEHIRYDLTIEIAEGGDVLDAVSKLRQILRALKPLPKGGYAETKAKDLVAMAPEDKQKAVEAGRYSDDDFIKAKQLLEKIESRKEKREAALKLFNDLAGASVYTDHKEQWDDDYDDY